MRGRHRKLLKQARAAGLKAHGTTPGRAPFAMFDPTAVYSSMPSSMLRPSLYFDQVAEPRNRIASSPHVITKDQIAAEYERIMQERVR